MSQKSLNLPHAHLPRVPFAMPEHKAPVPPHIALLRLEGKMLEPDRPAQLIFELHVKQTM
jgi:hypothetical protein